MLRADDAYGIRLRIMLPLVCSDDAACQEMARERYEAVWRYGELLRARYAVTFIVTLIFYVEFVFTSSCCAITAEDDDAPLIYGDGLRAAAEMLPMR